MKRTILILIIAVAGAAVFLMSCRTNTHSPLVRTTTAMNTYVTISVYDDSPNERIIHSLDSAVAEIQRIERMATNFNDSSEIGRINLASGKHPVEISEELVEVIRRALTYSVASSGMFDITVGPIVKEWDFLSSNPHVPPAGTIRKLLSLVDYHLVEIRGRSVYLPRQGMALDLGSLGKGYAIQRVCDILARNGATRFIVDMGGKLGVHWEGTSGLDSTGITVYVRHPRKKDAFLGEFKYGTGAVATSGDYERFFFADGKRYHHLLDPNTGYPFNGLVSVTVVEQNAAEADALSAVIFLLGREKGMEFIRETPGLEGILVSESGDSLQIDVSPGLEGGFIAAKNQK